MNESSTTSQNGHIGAKDIRIKYEIQNVPTDARIDLPNRHQSSGVILRGLGLHGG
jgi:hypothetical protein